MGPDAELDESDPEVFAAVFREGLRGLSESHGGHLPACRTLRTTTTAATARFGEMVVVLDGIMEALDAGRDVSEQQLARFQELLGGGIGMPGLSMNVANRFGQAANSVIECYQSGFLYGFLSGGPVAVYASAAPSCTRSRRRLRAAAHPRGCVPRRAARGCTLRP